MSPSVDRVSAVVCSKNSAASMERCLQSLRENGVGEIIVVDASSTDGTTQIAGRLADQVLTDPGVGLGAARNVGISRATLDFVLNCGADNVMPPGSVADMIAAKEAGPWAGVSAITLVEGRGYLARAMCRYKVARFSPGERTVIGTPTLFDAAKLRAHPFDEKAAHSDDAELCERWAGLFGARFAIADVIVREAGQEDLRSVVDRFTRYGVSDAEIYRRSSPHWSRRRRIKSVLHPLRVDFVEPLQRIPFPADIACVPFLLLATGVRYLGWFRDQLRELGH